MPRPRRSEVFEEDTVGIYHCVNRCVRRAFLCGFDPATGKSFAHRKDWVQERLETLAAIFAIDVLGYALLDNHLHVVLRNRPDIVRSWSDQEVARRWWRLFPKRREQDGRPAEPQPHELRMLTADRKKLREFRQRLSHISWFMRCLAENIARRVNKEENNSGRFWAGRYKMTRILDETALLAVAIYVDLNPIRAGIAKTPETSCYTSAYDRIHADGAARRNAVRGSSPAAKSTRGDGWLSPIPLEPGPVKRQAAPQYRASNQGFLSLTPEQYLSLLDWTGRQVRQDKRGSIPADLAPILERLQIVEEQWFETVLNFGRAFRTAAGRIESLAAEAARRGRSWLPGMRASRRQFSRN